MYTQSPTSKSHHSSLKINPNFNPPPQEPTNEIDTRWTQLKFQNCFTPRSYFASCIQAGNIYLHGGFSPQQGIMKDMYYACLYDLPLVWLTIPISKINPGPLRNHTLVSYRSNLLLVGGQKNVMQNNNKIYRYDLLHNCWSVCECFNDKKENYGRAIDSHCALVYNDWLYIMFGYDSKTGNYLNEITKINLKTIDIDQLTYQIVKVSQQSPCPRGTLSSCILNTSIYIFGGSDLTTTYADLWQFDLQTSQWKSIPNQNTLFWPQQRKGHIMVSHPTSHCLFLFGGICKITKQQNDILVYSITKKHWIKIHSTTNEIYESSPTLKYHVRNRQYDGKDTGKGFKIQLQNVPLTNIGEDDHQLKKMHATFQHSIQEASDIVTVPATTMLTMKKKISGEKKMSVAQQKKYREFMNRKKKLLNSINANTMPVNNSPNKRSYSPTSESIVFSLTCMGEQNRNDSHFEQPKVIYDGKRCQVIGKKPCARDGHAGLIHQGNILIIGGDRHMVSFNDSYFFEMSKGIQSLQLYDK